MTFKIPAEGLPAFTDASGVTTGQGRMEHKLFKRDQSWCYEAIWALCGRKLRVMVTRNAYDNQSFCKIQAFHEDTTEWKFLCDVPFTTDLACFGVSWAAETPDQLRFETDADLVLEKACRILNPFYAAAVTTTAETPVPYPPMSGAYVTKVVMFARIHFSDGNIVERELDR